MNFTLSMDEELVERARKVARAAMGTSLNQMIRDYIEALAGKV